MKNQKLEELAYNSATILQCLQPREIIFITNDICVQFIINTPNSQN